jgi:hypothetical protein
MEKLLSKVQKTKFYCGETWLNLINKSQVNNELWFEKIYKKDNPNLLLCDKKTFVQYCVKSSSSRRISTVKIPKKLNDYILDNCTILR